MKNNFFLQNSKLDHQPAFYTILSAIGVTLFYTLSSVLMIAVIYNSHAKCTIGYIVLAAFTHFLVLAYFFWLLIAVVMHYFTIKFQLNNFRKFFFILGIASISKSNAGLKIRLKKILNLNLSFSFAIFDRIHSSAC
jgi:hypothetical protein